MRFLTVSIALFATAFAYPQDTSAAKPAPAPAPKIGISELVPRNVGPTSMGGRIADIAVYEKQPRIFYVASASGGLWKTENDGITFTPQFTKESVASLGCVSVSQKDPNLVWVGTGEPSSRNSVGWGGGVYKSTDGGSTWKSMGLSETMYISRIVIDPKNNDIVYVAALGNLWGFGPDRGLYKTIDGGKTWNKVLFVDDKAGIGDLVMDPSNHNVLLAASWQRLRKAWDFVNGGPGGALWRSTDAGKTWKKITKGLPPGPFGRIGLNFFRKDPRIMVATVEYRMPEAPASASEYETGENDMPGFDGDRDLVEQTPQAEPAKQAPQKPADAKKPEQVKEDSEAARKAEAAKGKLKAVPEPPRGGTYLSRDGGASWSFTNTLNPRPFYFSIPRYDPNDINRIYVPGISLHYSEDQGKTFRVMHETVHVDHHAMWIDPNDSSHIMIGEDGGVGVTYDRGKSWKMLNNLPVGQFYIATYDMRRPYWVYGGLQDNGCWASPTQTRRGGVIPQDAYSISGGDGFYVQVDPTDWRTVYSESQGGGLVRTDQLTGEQRYIAPRTPKGEKPYRFNWNSPIVLSPYNSRIIYIGGNKLFRSIDKGDHWEPISPDLTTNDPEKQRVGKESPTPDIDSGAERHCTITTVSESPMKPGLIWCGTDDGQVQVTQDGGATWTNVTANLGDLPKNLWVSRIQASKFAEGRAYMAVDGHRSNNFAPYVYVTEDYGKTWKDLSPGLPDRQSSYVVTEGQKNQNLLLVGTEGSIMVSLDRGATWTKYDNPGFPTVPVFDLQIHPRELDLIVGTHGRCIWTINVAGLEQIGADTLNQDAAVFQPKDVLLLGRVSSPDWEGDQQWSAVNTQPGTEIPYYLKADQKDEATLTISDVLGTTSEDYKVGKTAGYHVYVWKGTLKGRRAKAGDYKVTLKAAGKEFSTTVHVEDVSETMS